VIVNIDVSGDYKFKLMKEFERIEEVHDRVHIRFSNED